MPDCVSNYDFRAACRASTGAQSVCVCVFTFTSEDLAQPPFLSASAFWDGSLSKWPECLLKSCVQLGWCSEMQIIVFRLHRPSLHRLFKNIIQKGG